MPYDGQSLVGFLSREAAINHLRHDCVSAPGATDADLEAIWVAATAALGQPVAGAGYPDIQPLPANAAAHVATLSDPASPYAHRFGALGPADLNMIEVDKLLAFQLTVDGGRSDFHCNGFSNPPTIDEMLPVFLPSVQVEEKFSVMRGPNSVLIKAKSLNIRTFSAGFFDGQQDDYAGIVFGVSLPHVHVVRFNGRCYLYNGFHRAVGARLCGASHVPCILRDINSADEIGAKSFPIALLESANPPTLAHFTGGRALSVKLRSVSRALHVSWAEYVVPDD